MKAAYPLNANAGWLLQTNSINVADPGAWFPYPNSTAVTTVNIPVNPALPQVFFRLIKP